MDSKSGIFKNLLIAATGSFGRNRTHDDLRRWVETNGGNFTIRLCEEVTHLVCTKVHWDSQVNTVKAALKLNVAIISYDWLEDSIYCRRRRAEKAYLWKNLARLNKSKKTAQGKGDRKALKKDAREFKESCEDSLDDIGSGTSSSISTPIKATGKTTAKPKLPSTKSDGQILVEALMAEAEEDFVSTRGVTKKFAAGASKLAAARKTQQIKAKRSVGITSTKAKSMIKKNKPETLKPAVLSAREREANAAARAAAKRAKDDERANKDWLFPENYHIYRDFVTNEEYRVTLTRLDIRKNKFERYEIRLYETNYQPHRYATYVRYLGLEIAPVAEMKAPLASDFDKAFGAFKDAFFEQTLIRWDDRDKAGGQQRMEGMDGVPDPVGLGEDRNTAVMPVGPFVYRRYSNV